MRGNLKTAMILSGVPVLLAGSLAAGLWGLSQKPAYCGYCHVMEPYYRSWTASDYSAHQHALASVTCQTCHPQSMRQLVYEIVSTVRGSYQEPLPAMRISKDQCLTCHESYDALARATAGLEINPHAAHIGEEECWQCHKMHRKSPGMKYCMTCHHTGELVPCKQCHQDR